MANSKPTIANIDNLIKDFPKFNRFDQISTAILRICKDEWEKARGIFTWNCLNIQYALAEKGKFPPSRTNETPENVLRSGKAECGGYAGVFCHLAELVGLKSVRINGYAKAYGYKPGKRFMQTDHAWNALLIEGEWYLMETTWGAGFVDDDHKYIKRFDPCWFAMDPRIFLYNHFPEDPKWLLFPTRISFKDFEQGPFVPTYDLEKIMKSGFETDAILKILTFAPLPNCFGQHCLAMSEKGFYVEEILKILRSPPFPQNFFFDCCHLKEFGFTIDEILILLKHQNRPKCYQQHYCALKQKGFSVKEILAFLECSEIPDGFFMDCVEFKEMGFSFETIRDLLKAKALPEILKWMD